MISVLVLHDAFKYQEVKEIFMFFKSPWHPMLIYSLVFPVSSNISCLLCNPPTVYLLEFTPPLRRPLAQPPAQSRVTSELWPGFWGLFHLGLENLQEMSLHNLSRGSLFYCLTLSTLLFFLLLFCFSVYIKSESSLFQFTISVSHPPVIWRDFSILSITSS